MQWTLEVVQVPVADVERAKRFYTEQLGFTADLDVGTDAGRRFVQLTPPGSSCSIQLSSGYFHDLAPGSLRGLVLVVPDIRSAHAQLVRNGVDNRGVVVSEDGVTFRAPLDGEALDNVGFVHFRDPDGNEWSVQQISTRGPRHDLALTRLLDAPLEQAWKAWTEPSYVTRWWGPRGFTSPLADMDVRVGGTSLVCMRAPAELGGQDIYTTWTYQNVLPREQLEFSLDFTDADRVVLPDHARPPGVPRAVRHVITFAPTDDRRTTMTVQEFGYATAEARDISQAGLEQCLDKMEEMLSSSRGPASRASQRRGARG
jgi:uncharacterized protein YndB with AHSA1/START domain/catechol 2,3-dioxygenase-like lactoylglutathione lyase family enzyme